MVFGAFFGTKSVERAATPILTDEESVGYFRLAFPAWSIPGVRIVPDEPVIKQASRNEIEELFSLELRRSRLGARLSQKEALELELNRSLRRALYDDRIAA